VVLFDFNEVKIHEIMKDDALGRDEKIDMLRDIESEARALQRTASEGPMNAEDGWETDLREVRLALFQLGAAELRKGAASL
jgi:hypothetical protein